MVTVCGGGSRAKFCVENPLVAIKGFMAEV